MRDENKRTYYIGKPVKETDTWNTVSVSGYAPLTAYKDVLNENAYREESEKFGDNPSQRPQIAHDDNDGATPDIDAGDGVWLEQPTADANEQYQNPPFVVDSVNAFGRKHVYVLKRTVEPR